MINGRASVMSETMVLNYSVGSSEVLVASDVGFMLGASTRMVVGY